MLLLMNCPSREVFLRGRGSFIIGPTAVIIIKLYLTIAHVHTQTQSSNTSQES